MLQLRAFRNDDPPALADMWRGQPASRGLLQPCAVGILERSILSKPYFDRLGLIVASDDDQVVGFLHAGFGCNEDRSRLSTELGVLSMFMVAMHRNDAAEICARLIAAGEEYLHARGARRVLGAGVSPHHPFYLGLYGGAQLPGVLASDGRRLEALRAAGYERASERIVLQRPLAGFRSIINRQQMQLRREYVMEANLDPPTECWWDACTEGQTDRTRFALLPRAGGRAVASALYWDMEPLASGWGVNAMGLVRLEFPDEAAGEQLATLLLGESIRQLQTQGVSLVEVHVDAAADRRQHLYSQLGFQEVDRGYALVKSLA